MAASAARRSQSQANAAAPAPQAPLLFQDRRARDQAMLESLKARGIEFEPYEVKLTPEGFLIDDNPDDQPVPPSRHPRCKLTERELYETIKPHLDARDIEFEYVEDGDPPSFDIGRRPVFRYDEDGFADLVDYVPMNRADALFPREGDEIMGNFFHALAINILFNIARLRLGDDPTFRCYTDTSINVGIIGHGAVKPDLAVMTGATFQSSAHLGTFYLARETDPRFRCRLAVEVSSPKSTRRNDLLIKRAIYADAGFEQYALVDVEPETKRRPRKVSLLDMRPNEHTYMDPMPVRASGRIPLLGLGVWLGLVNGDKLAVYESERGKRIRDYPDAVRAAGRAERRAAREHKRAEAEKARAEAEKARAEAEKARAEDAEARAATEKTRAEDAEARAEAEKTRAEAEKTRAEDAEARAEAEKTLTATEKTRAENAEALAEALAENMKRMEAEMRRLRSETNGTPTNP